MTTPGQLELLPRDRPNRQPDDPPLWGGPAAVPSGPITTRGRTEYTVRCSGDDGCGQTHRHISPGIRRGPCGALYTIPDPAQPTEEEL